MERIILPSISSAHNSSWHSRVDEVQHLGLQQIALFVTTLEKDQRSVLYQELKKISGLRIPFVHARSDMRQEEYKRLIGDFGAERFNLHPLRKFPDVGDLSSLQDKIYIENGWDLLEGDLEGFAGICLDLAHLDSARRYDQNSYQTICRLVERYPVGANHISAIVLQKGKYQDWHTMGKLTELDYLKKYSEKYFGKYLALELTNPISEQLQAKEYLQKMLSF